jgi:hypothetical protein
MASAPTRAVSCVSCAAVLFRTLGPAGAFECVLVYYSTVVVPPRQTLQVCFSIVCLCMRVVCWRCLLLVLQHSPTGYQPLQYLLLDTANMQAVCMLMHSRSLPMHGGYVLLVNARCARCCTLRTNTQALHARIGGLAKPQLQNPGCAHVVVGRRGICGVFADANMQVKGAGVVGWWAQGRGGCQTSMQCPLLAECARRVALHSGCVDIRLRGAECAT